MSYEITWRTRRWLSEFLIRIHSSSSGALGIVNLLLTWELASLNIAYNLWTTNANSSVVSEFLIRIHSSFIRRTRARCLWFVCDIVIVFQNLTIYLKLFGIDGGEYQLSDWN